MLPLNQFDPDGSLWLLDKPLHWTSFDVVNKMKFLLGQKVGHAGTLDPLATGLLILGSGRGTKQMETLMGQAKEYTGTLTLGQTTPSCDRETAVEQERPWQHLTLADIEAALPAFTGEIQQRPPLFSAIKINGKKAYELARKGKDVVPDARTVTVSTFEITGITGPEVSFRIECSKGTYIRSLARDLGEALGCGAHLSNLIRTRIGDYRLEDAFSVEAMEQFRQPRAPRGGGAAPAETA